jgi:DNA-binding transcriptional ArsR family regulator
LHRGTFDTLLHRVRGLVEGSAELIRQDDHYELAVADSFTIVDPRCARPLEDQLLRALAESGGGSAKEIAQSLDIPLRSVQHLLKGLVEDGACLSEKDGRRVAYKVEDTTFQEPTRTELKSA